MERIESKHFFYLNIQQQLTQLISSEDEKRLKWAVYTYFLPTQTFFCISDEKRPLFDFWFFDNFL
jgi:hypothetical protein